MPIGSSWWTALGAAARWVHDFTGVSGTANDFGTGFYRVGLTFPKCYQGCIAGGDNVDPGYDTGIFYLVSGGTYIFATVVAVLGISDGDPLQLVNRPQWVELTPVCVHGDADPVNAALPGISAYFRTPFVIYNPRAYGSPGIPAIGMVCMWFAKTAGTYDLWHYEPWAWWGTPAEVVASILMQAGLPVAQIDTASFDDCYDAYSADDPWYTIYLTHGLPEVYVARKVGKTVASTVQEVVRHTRDFLCVQMDGTIALKSGTRPPSISSLTHDDGVTRVTWEWAEDYIFNRYGCMAGHAFRSWGDDSNPPDDPAPGLEAYTSVEEPSLDSERHGKWTVEGSDATSISKFETIDLPGTKTLIQINKGRPREVQRSSFPFFLNSAWLDAIITEYAPADAVPRRVITVEQDWRGLDYDVGDRVLNVALTGDGLTIDVMRCIKKRVDFGTMRVVSTLLEEPALS